VPPKKKGQTEQPRWTERAVDIDEALAHWQVAAVLERWGSARMHEAPAYSGGVLDAWPAVMVDGLAVCRSEEQAIDDFKRWKERADG
jgi:hypothetical protein